MSNRVEPEGRSSPPGASSRPASGREHDTSQAAPLESSVIAANSRPSSPLIKENSNDSEMTVQVGTDLEEGSNSKQEWKDLKNALDVDGSQPETAPIVDVSWGELAKEFSLLGYIGFGGPAAHVGLFQRVRLSKSFPSSHIYTA